MGNAVFPTLPGLQWNVKKIPVFSTRVQKSVSGKPKTAADMAYPLWQFEMSYALLRADATAELQTLMGFFLQRSGAFDSFLFEDPDDKSVVDQQFGTGNGSATQFQLVRSLGGFVEPIQNVNGSPTIKVNGVTKATPADYSINSTGLVTFTTPPANGATITWTGSFYFRVHFTIDEAEFNKFSHQLWDLKKVKMESWKL